MHAGGDIGVCCDAAGALSPDQFSPVVRLADQFIAGGEVQNQRRSVQRQTGTRRNHRPHILADLDSDPEFRRDLEDQISSERHLVESGEWEHLRLDPPSGREVAFFIELPVVRQIDFRHHSEDRSVLHHHGGIEEPSAEPDRGADGIDGISRQSFRQFRDPLFRLIQQGGIVKQVRTRVSGDRQFGKQNHGSSGSGGLLRQMLDLFNIETHIRDLQTRHTGGNPIKAIHRGTLAHH